MLSNYEVFKLLTDLKEKRKDSGRNKHSVGQQNLNTITYETLKHLSNTPCSRQSPEIVKEFLTTMMPHKLTKAEKLQLLNHRPQTAVEIQLVSDFYFSVSYYYCIDSIKGGNSMAGQISVTDQIMGMTKSFYFHLKGYQIFLRHESHLNQVGLARTRIPEKARSWFLCCCCCCCFFFYYLLTKSNINSISTSFFHWHHKVLHTSAVST
uniref:DNA-directed RNA polymerase III subunit RPC9 n=1 Tax=Echeneis naucrates TaxID=173247 RepID=A0A665TYR4_ECHNA